MSTLGDKSAARTPSVPITVTQRSPTYSERLASERAMQMITATMCGAGSDMKKLATVDRIVNAWVDHPHLLTNDAMVEDLPIPESYSTWSVHLYNECLKRHLDV